MKLQEPNPVFIYLHFEPGLRWEEAERTAEAEANRELILLAWSENRVQE